MYMTPKEKLKYVKDKIDELVEISPKGVRHHIPIYTLTEYEEGPTMMTRNEQCSIYRKYEEEGYIKNVTFGEKGLSVQFEKDVENGDDEKTSTDYIVEALNYFKDEYNKVRINGLTYEYLLGINFNKSDYEPQPNEVNHAYYRRIAIERLKEVGFVRDFELEERVVDDYGNVDDYAICKIDESKLVKEEAPEATNAGVQDVAEKVIKYEHVHRFENSIQEKDLTLHHKHDKKQVEPFYITKENDDFHYKGRYINLSKKTDYFKVFCALYAKLPNGGLLPYSELISEIKSRIPKTAGKTDDEMQKFIQRNLTDKRNGFMRYAGIPETEDSGKPLIDIVRGYGVKFNNKAG